MERRAYAICVEGVFDRRGHLFLMGERPLARSIFVEGSV
jgi:hypothetical protein